MQVEIGYYKHYKGNVYQVIGVGKHSENLEDVVVYKSLYVGTYGYGAIWVRPIAMFVEEVEVNGQKIPRFKRITSDEAVAALDKV